MPLVFWVFAAIVFLFGFVVFRGAPYVPSHKKEVEQAFEELYAVGEDDLLVDVGSGDGIILRLAAKRGAHAVGYELNPALVMISRFLSRRYKNIRIQLRDFWLTPLPEGTTIVYGFTVTRDIKKMARKLQAEADRLGRPLFFISYGAVIKDRTPVKDLSAHHLYRFDPLQERKA